MKNSLLRVILRPLVRRPGSSLAIILLLALALGSVGAVFTVLDAVVLSPLELDDPDELLWVWSRHRERGALFERSSEANVVDWRHSPGPFESLAAAHNRALTWSNTETPEKLSVVVTTSDFFTTLGARPLLGRAFEPGDEDQDLVLLHERFWRTRLGGRGDVLGQNLVLDQRPHQVVGVMPASFELPRDGADIYLTRRLQPDARRFFRSLWVIGRLAPGSTKEAAQRHLDRLGRQLAERHPEVNRGWEMAMTPLAEHLTANVRPALWTLFGGVLLVMLIALGNVAYLLLLRTAERRHELAVRQALGAGGLDPVRRLLSESLLFATLGGILGFLLARAALPWLLTRVPAALPRQAEIGLDLRVLAFGGLSVLTAALVCGLVPAMRAGRQLTNPLRSAGRSSAGREDRRLRVGLVVGEVALAMVLLSVGGLLVRSFDALSKIDPGFESGQRAVVRIFGQPGAMEPVEKELYFRQLEEHLASVPGVVSVGASTALPLSRIGLPLTTPWRGVGESIDDGVEEHTADMRLSSPGFLPTLGVPLLAGRYLDTSDRRDSQPVVLINETLARQAFPGKDPVGRSLRLGTADWSERRVVGVVGDLRHDSLLIEARPEVYLPISQHDHFAGLTFVLHTEASAEALVSTLRRAVIAFDPDQPPHSVTTLGAIFEQATARERFAAELLGLFALFALALAAFGLYAVLAAVVAGRRREIGVRRALGAQVRDIRALVLGAAGRWTALGIAFGLGLTLLVGRWIDSLLVGVEANDLATLGGAVVLLVVVTLAAAWIPTRQALRVEAWRVLRDE